MRRRGRTCEAPAQQEHGFQGRIAVPPDALQFPDVVRKRMLGVRYATSTCLPAGNSTAVFGRCKGATPTKASLPLLLSPNR